MGVAGPRGYPGSKGLSGNPGQQGATGAAGANGATPTVYDNGNGTYTITGSNGSITISDGNTPAAANGEYISFVFGLELTGNPPPTITDNTGSYNGSVEVFPTGSVSWINIPSTASGYTTYVSTNRYVHDADSNTWSLKNNSWSTPQVYLLDSSPPVAQLVSYAFKRNVGQPTTPVGGSYADPNPTTIGWEDGIPSGTEPVYMSKRVFTQTGGPPQDANWSIPNLLGSSGSGTKFQFAATSTGPWHDIPLPTDEWMIVCTEDAAGNWVCDTANPVKIKGEQGNEAQSKITAYAFKRSVTELVEAPEGGSFADPSPVDTTITGWTSFIPDGEANLYVSTRTFTTDGLPPQDSTWSLAQLFSGQNGINFVVSSDSYVFLFDEDDNPVSPDTITFTANKQNIGNDTNWTTDPATAINDIAANPTATDTFSITKEEFATIGLNAVKFIGTAGTYTDEITIAKISDGNSPIPGIDYSDGQSIFQSKIYKASATNPGAPSGGSWDGSTETVPVGWSEDPVATAAGEYLWESNFVYIASQINGVNTWDAASQPYPTGPIANAWSNPVQYSYIPTLGVDYFNGDSFQSYIFKNEPQGTTPSTPTGGSFDGTTEVVPTGWTDGPQTPAGDELTWVSDRLYTTTNGVWDTPPAWSTPSVFSGSASLTGVLTNESETVTSGPSGNNVNLLGNEGGEFLVYFGTDDVTSDCTFSIVGGTTTHTQNGLKVTFGAGVDADNVYSVAEVTAGSWNSSSLVETFTFIATHRPSGFISTRKYTIAKSQEGAIGVSGTATRLDIAYADDASGTGASYPSVTFDPRVYTTANPSGKTYMGTNAVTWVPPDSEPATSTTAGDYEWSLMTGADGTDGASNRIDFAYADTVDGGGIGNTGLIYPTAGTPATPSATSKYLGSNVVTWTPPAIEPAISNTPSDYEWGQFRGDDGTDGTDGTDSLSVVLSNGSHTIPTDSAGANGDYTGSGTTIKVFEGATELTFITGTTPANGEWRISSSTDTNISGGSITDSGTYATVGEASSFATGTVTLTASTVHTITGKTSNGTTFNLTAQQSFAKALAGTDGTPGGAQISVTGTGTVTAGSGNISVVHPSAGNNIDVIWQFRLRGNGTNEPNSTTDISLKANGTPISTVNFNTIESFNEEGINFWIAFKNSATYAHTNSTEGDITFTITIANAGTYDTPSVDYAVITTVESL